jgi:hypothetical protein
MNQPMRMHRELTIVDAVAVCGNRYNSKRDAAADSHSIDGVESDTDTDPHRAVRDSSCNVSL